MGKFKLKWRMNERGLSLVEVLASIVILSIVFMGFMAIFPQMTNFNKKTETKLETMNVARQEIVEIQSLVFTNPLNESQIKSKIGPKTVKSGDNIIASYKKGDYQYEADFYTNADLGNEADPDNIALYKVHLKVIVDGKVNSETFGYIEVEGN